MPNSVWRESLSRSILDLVEDKANIGSWSWDLETGDMNWSVGVYRIFAISPDEQPSMSHIGSMVDGNDAVALRSSNPLVTARHLADRKFSIRRLDGEVRIIHSHGKLLASTRDGRAHFVGAFLDITESRLQDELFLLREAILESMRDLFEVAIWQTDADGSVSDPMQWRMALGKDAGPAGAWGRLQLVHPDDKQTVRDAWARAVAERTKYISTFRMLQDGEYVQAQSKAVSLLDGSGEVLGWIGYTRRLNAAEVAPDSAGMITAAQIRAARAMLNWSGRELATYAGVSFSSVRRAESEDISNVTAATLGAIRDAFERSGLSFHNDADRGTGVSASSFIPNGTG